MLMRASLKIVLGAAAATLATAGSALALADGLYGCRISTFNLGEIRIDGLTYAGPAYDGAFGASHSYVEKDGTITWHGPLGGISAAGTIVSTVLTQSGDQIGFDVMIRNAAGRFQTVSCLPVF